MLVDMNDINETLAGFATVLSERGFSYAEIKAEIDRLHDDLVRGAVQ